MSRFLSLHTPLYRGVWECKGPCRGLYSSVRCEDLLRMVPASSTWTCWKRRSENSGAKGAKSRITVVGRVRIIVHLFRQIGDERTLPFPPTNGQSPAQRLSTHLQVRWGSDRLLACPSPSSAGNPRRPVSES